MQNIKQASNNNKIKHAGQTKTHKQKAIKQAQQKKINAAKKAKTHKTNKQTTKKQPHKKNKT